MKSPNARTLCAAALALLLALAAPAAAQQPPPPPPPKPRPQSEAPQPIRWQEFRSEAGGFRVKLPSAPKISAEPFTRATLSFTRHTHEAAHGTEHRFEVDYIDLPRGYDDPALTLEGGIAGLVQSMTANGARVLTRETVTRGTCEGRDVTLELPPRGPLRSGFAQGRTFRSGQRMYLVFFISFADPAAARETASTFVESFVVEDGCRAPVAPAAVATAAPTRRSVPGKPDAATGWRLIDAAEHGFVALLPGEVQLQSQQAQVEPFPLHHHEYTVKSQSAFYTAEVVGEYPSGFFASQTSMKAQGEVAFFSLRRNLEPVGFKLTLRRELSVRNFPGQEYDLAHDKLPGRGRAQVFITPRRVYIFIGYDDAPANLERFFSSIKITPN